MIKRAMTKKLKQAMQQCKIFGLIGCFILIACSKPSDESNTPASMPSKNGKTPEAYTLDGKPLFAMKFDSTTKARLDSNLAVAQANFDADPDDPENIIWLGRRTAYLTHYKDAIKIYSAGLQQYPDNFKLLRHRGHRYISIRKFDNAIADLERATELIEGVPDEVELDGAPNKYNIPTSTSHFNIRYHLGLAYYLKSDFENALRAYREGMKFSNNPDALVAASDWLYMALRRMGREQEAEKALEPISEEMKILENHAYFNRLLMYKGLKSPEDLLDMDKEGDLQITTYGYGIGNWYLYNGDKEKAIEIFKKVTEGSYWPAFGFIAAEADLQRLANE
jgi:tetratricopeptide (TPR) repeat protein